MEISHININHICTISCRLITQNHEYRYKEFRPATGLFKRFKKDKPAGFYSTYYENEGLTSDYYFHNREDMFIRDKKIYFYPYLRITLINGEYERCYFKSHRDMFEFMSKFLLNHPSITFLTTTIPSEKRYVLLEKYEGYSDELRLLLKDKGLNTDKEILQ